MQFFLATYYWPPLGGSLPSIARFSTCTRPLSIAPPSNWLMLFSSQTFKYPNSLIPVILPANTACEDGTVYSETPAYKIQRRRNPQKEEYDGKDVPVHAMKAYRGSTAPHPGYNTPSFKSLQDRFTRGWVGSTASLEILGSKKVCRSWESNLYHPVYSLIIIPTQYSYS